MDWENAGGLLRQMIGVEGLVVRGARLEERGVVVAVRPRQRRPRCGVCGRPGLHHDTSEERVWRHLPLGRTVFWLSYAPRRVDCREHGVTVEQVPWAAHGSDFTHAYEEMTARLAQHLDKTAVRKLMGIARRPV